MQDGTGEILFDKTLDLSSPYRLGDDPRTLQLAFASLGDLAAQSIYLAGSDFDEVLMERILLVRSGEKTSQVPAEFLADAERLKELVVRRVSESPGLAELSVVAVRTIVRLDRMCES